MPQLILKADRVNPFLRAIREMVSTMLGGTVARGKPSLSGGHMPSGYLMAIIGFNGPITGTVALALPPSTARNMTAALLMQEPTEVDSDIIDTMAEMVNIIAGAAKADLSIAAGQTLELSLPAVVRGDDYVVESPSRVIWLDVPLTSTFGEFLVRMTFEKQ